MDQLLSPDAFVTRVEVGQKVSVGVSTVIGVLGAVGTVIAGWRGNDASVVVGGVAAVTMMVGRYGQAIARIRAAARFAQPWVNAVADMDVPQDGRTS